MNIADITAFAGQWMINLETDLTRYVIFAVGTWLALWVVFARPLAGRKIRPERPKTPQLATEFAVSLRSIAIFSTIGMVMFALERAGLLPGPAMAANWGPWWAVGSLILMIVAHDAYFYWTHRLIHDPRLFRTFHRRHHRSNNPSPFTAYSFDLAEAAVLAAFVPIWMLLVPTPWAMVGVFMLHQIARNTLGHSGYELFPAGRDGRPLIGFLTTTTHHDLHHAEAGWNYGLYFTWWDRLMSTEHPNYHARFAAAVRARPLKAATNQIASASASVAALLLLSAALPVSARAQPQANIAGRWATEGFGSIVEFLPCAGAETTMCGRISWLWRPNTSAGRPRTDIHNPDAALRARPLVGVEIVRDLRETAPNVWGEGAVYNPDDGRTYTGTVRLRNATLELQGCALSVFCQTQVWRRPEDILAAAQGN